MRDHTVVVGYGDTGRAAVDALLGTGVRAAEVVVVDVDPTPLDTAAARGLRTVVGDATHADVLRCAGVPDAATLVVAISRADTTVLVTLTARGLAPATRVVVTARETEHANLLRQSGAGPVVVTAETTGRLLGLAVANPRLADVIQCLFDPGVGLPIDRPR